MNTQSTIYAVAERAADLIREDHRARDGLRRVPWARLLRSFAIRRIHDTRERACDERCIEPLPSVRAACKSSGRCRYD